MKNKRNVKGAKVSKNYTAKGVTKKVVNAKVRTGGATISAGFLKVPARLQKTLTAAAKADPKFKGTWKSYALTHLKEIAPIAK